MARGEEVIRLLKSGLRNSRGHLTRSAAKRCSRRKLAMLKEANATGVR